MSEGSACNVAITHISRYIPADLTRPDAGLVVNGPLHKLESSHFKRRDAPQNDTCNDGSLTNVAGKKV
jgi:hypothetical protein